MSQARSAHQVQVEIGGRTLTLETGKLAKQANGAILAKYGDTQVLVTACMESTAERARFSAADGGLSRVHLLRRKNSRRIFQARRPPFGARNSHVSRLIDRPLRPLFPEAWRNETQIVAMVLSADSENDPDVIAVTAASAAAFISDLPFTSRSPRCASDCSREAWSPTPPSRSRKKAC